METIKNYVEALFSSIPASEEANRLKEDMLLNLEEKYNALLSTGKSEAEAVGIVIMGIGTAEDLKAALNDEKLGKSRVKVSFKGVNVEDGDDKVHVGWDGVHVESNGDGTYTVSENEDGTFSYHQENGSKFPFAAILWPLCIIAFLIMGFAFHLWHYAWLVFAAAVIVTILYSSVAEGYRKKDLFGAVEGCVWTMVVAGYLYVGFKYSFWHPGWIIFPIVGLMDGIAHSVYGYCKSRTEKEEK